MTDNTVISDAHFRVIKLLETRGLCLQEEIDFPPFRVDIYLPDYHVCVEVDGPHHSERANRLRDRELESVYHMPTFRVNVSDIDDLEWLKPLLLFLSRAVITKDARWGQCEMRTPWL